MWRINAIFLDGTERTYTLNKFPFDRIREIITTAENEGVFLLIYHLKGEQEVKVYDSLFTDMMYQVVKDDVAL